MNVTRGPSRHPYLPRIIVFLIIAALIVGTASCNPVKYNLIISSTEGGEVTTPGEGTYTYNAGTVIDLVAAPNAGYQFNGWTGNVTDIADVNAATTNITLHGDYLVTANFVPIHKLTISSTAGGSVIEPGEGHFDYVANTTIVLVAEANQQYRFVNWSGDVGTIADVNAVATTITMRGDYEITANFELEYNLTITSTYGGSVTEPGEGIFTYSGGTVVDLVAENDDFYEFVSWTGDVGTIVDVEDNSTTITIEDSYVITANFAPVSSEYLEIWDWYDLDAVRDNMVSKYILMNDLDSTTSGYEELASPTSNEGEGWQPIGTTDNRFTGILDGQGYEVRDMFINRPDGYGVGLFGAIGEVGVINGIGVVDVDVIGEIIVGGLAASSHGTVSHSYSTGSVSGITDVGGLLGINTFEHVSDSYSTCSVAGDRFVGGLIGYSGGPVSDCYATGNVIGDDHIGGLMGQSTGHVSNSYATGSVTGNSSIGGLMGENEGKVSNSYAIGNVSGDTRIGGLIGRTHGFDIVDNSYSTGSVTGNSYVGGLVGGSYGTVSNSYATGSVAGISYVGGLVGASYCTDWSCGIVINSFWDTETSGQATSDGGTGKTTAQMKNIATFSGAKWNIITVGSPGARNPAYIWNIVNGLTYPFLSWEP